MKQSYTYQRHGELWYPGDYREPYEITVKSQQKQFVEYMEEKIQQAIEEYDG